MPTALPCVQGALPCHDLQLTRQNKIRRRAFRGILVAICAATALALACSAALDGSHLGWNLDCPETAVAATSLHAFEWALVRVAPFVLAGAAAGLLLTKRRG